MVRLAVTLTLAASVAGGADIVSAAKLLMPKGAHLVVAEELDGSFGVVAYDYRGATTAAALKWADGGWRRADGAGVRVSRLEPRPGSTIGRKPAYVHVKIAATRVDGPAGVWLDGRQLQLDFAANLEWYYVVRHPRPGRRSVVVFVAAAPRAKAVAWNFTVR